MAGKLRGAARRRRGAHTAGILEAGGQTRSRRSTISSGSRSRASRGYDLDDAGEHEHVSRLGQGMVAQCADIATATMRDGDLVLPGLGNALASVAAAMSRDGDLDEG